MSITQQQQKELTLAAVNCEHQIDVDCIRLWRDPTKDGSALAQLMDRIETKVRQYIEQGAGADVVMVPRKVLEACSESLGSFCSEHGWSQADMDNMDALDLFLVVQHPQQEQPK